VAPSSLPALVNRHRAATIAGVPVPVVRDTFEDLGIAVFEELTGPLLKDQIKAGRPEWPQVDDFDRLAEQFAQIEPHLAVVPSRVAHGVLHAQMLRTIGGLDGGQLGRLTDAFVAFDSDVELQTIHGDLHEGQIVVDGRRIAGVLDLDDLGTGSPLEERANLLGFLRYRAITLPAHRTRITDYADQLRRNGATRHDQRELDIATAAVLVGLATGPFRIQQTGWRDTVSTLIAHAESHLPAQRTHIAIRPRCPDHPNTPSPPPLEES
jgi:Ser/Thr protein kinase RdoA (MazF antagonist)